jgi:hypothetical protein
MVNMCSISPEKVAELMGMGTSTGTGTGTGGFGEAGDLMAITEGGLKGSPPFAQRSPGSLSCRALWDGSRFPSIPLDEFLVRDSFDTG